jgi:hypothetical protein
MKILALFVAGAIFFSAAALGAGYLFWGIESVVQGSASLALTFPPALATLGWLLYSFRAAPEMQMLASLGGSGLRMAIALGGGLFVTSVWPQYFALLFWCWLSFFYLGFLGFEMFLLLRQPDDKNGARGSSAPS